MSRELRLCREVGGRKCGAFLSSLNRDPHPTCTRCRGKVCTRDLTCDFCVGWSSAQWELFAKKRICKDRKKSLPSGSVRPARELLRKFRSLELPPLLFPALQVGRVRGGGGGLRVHLVLCPVGLPPLPFDLGLARGGGGGSVSGCSSVAREHASVSSALSGAGEGEVARSQRTPPARSASSVASPRSSQHARRRDESGEVSEDLSFSQSSRVSRYSYRGTRKDPRARSRLDSSRDRDRRSRSRSASRSRLSGRECRRRSSSRSLSFFEWSRRVQSRSSDRSCSRRVLSRRDHSRRDRSRSEERGRRARREQQEGVESVNVSQAPVVSEAPAVATPPAGGATLAALPSAV